MLANGRMGSVSGTSSSVGIVASNGGATVAPPNASLRLPNGCSMPSTGVP